MKIIYTDENKRLRELGELVDSYKFRSFIQSNISKITEYSYGMKRVESHLSKKLLNEYFEGYNFKIDDKSSHAYGIGNNNMHYVQDLISGEYIGAIHLNTDMFGGMFLYASDINKQLVSNTYVLNEKGISCSTARIIDWNIYKFEKEKEVLNLIEKALRYNILESGPDNGVIVVKELDGQLYQALISKEDVAKDLIEQDQVSLLADQIKEMEKPEKGKLLEYKGLYFDEWVIDYDTGNIWSEMCEHHAKEFGHLLGSELSEGGMGCCSVYGCNEIGTENDSKHYYVNFDPEQIHFISEMVYKGQKILKDYKEAYFEPIVSYNQEKGFDTTFSMDPNFVGPYWDVFWFDGELGSIENEDFCVTLFASGEKKATLMIDGEEILTSSNAADFKPYLANDLTFHNLLDSDDPENHIVLHEQNSIDFTITDKATGKPISPHPDVFDSSNWSTLFCNDIRSAFTDVDTFKEIYDSWNKTHKNTYNLNEKIEKAKDSIKTTSASRNIAAERSH